MRAVGADHGDLRVLQRLARGPGIVGDELAVGRPIGRAAGVAGSVGEASEAAASGVDLPEFPGGGVGG